MIIPINITNLKKALSGMFGARDALMNIIEDGSGLANDRRQLTRLEESIRIIENHIEILENVNNSDDKEIKKN